MRVRACLCGVLRQSRLACVLTWLQNGVLEHETEMTDATVEPQRESKRRREHPEVPQAADSSDLQQQH